MIAFINKIWQHNIISTFLHRFLSIRITRKSQSVEPISFSETWVTDRSIFTRAVRDYEASLPEYANRKKYKIGIIGHSKNSETSTEFSLNGASEQAVPDKVLQSISEIDLTETDLIEEQLFDKSKQFLQIKKQSVSNEYSNYFDNFADQIDTEKPFFQILTNMFYKNIWNNSWTQSDEIKYPPANVDDQRRNQNNGEGSSNINNPAVDSQISDNPPVGQSQNQTGNVGQGFNMSEAEELWYYRLLNADVLSHQRFNQQKQLPFYQQHFYYQQPFINTQSNQFFYFPTFQPFYSPTSQPVYPFVSSFQQQPHFFFVFWYIQMNYQRFSLSNQFNQQSVVVSMITNNTLLFKVKNIEFFDFNPNVTQMIEIKDNYNIYHNVFSFTQRFWVIIIDEMVFIVTKNLHFCLMKTVDSWYTNELDDDSRRIYKINSIQQWCIALKGRFKKSAGQALTKFHQVQYTIADVRKRRDPSEFIQDVIILKSNSYTLTSPNAQAMYAFERIEDKFRIIMNPLISSSIITDIFRNMNFHKHDWFDAYFSLRFFSFKLFSSSGGYSASSSRFSQNGFFTKGSFIDYSGSSFSRSFGRNSETKTKKDSNQKKLIDISKYNNKSSQLKNEKHNDWTFTSNVNIKVESSNNSNADQSNSMTKSQFNHGYSNRNHRNNNRRWDNNQGRSRAYHGEHSDDDSSSQSSDRSDGRLTIDYPEVKKADEERIQKIDDDNVEIHFFNKINTVKTIIIKISCNQCNEKFDSNNKLHQHIKSKTCRKPRRPSISAIIFSTFSDTASNTVTNSAFNNINESIAPPFLTESPADIETNFKNLNSIDTNIHHVLSVKSFFEESQFVVSSTFSFFQPKEYGFRGWRYAFCNVILVKQNKLQNVYIDLKCMMFLIDRKFLKVNAFNVEIQKMNSSMTIKRVGTATHQTNEYVNIDFYLFTSINKIIHLKCEFYFVNDFKTNMLINIDIMTAENMIFNLSERKIVLIKHQDKDNILLSVSINITHRSANQIKWSIFNAIKTIIPPNSRQMVDIKNNKGKFLKLSKNRDLLFESRKQDNFQTYVHIINHILSFVQVFNSTDVSIILNRNIRLGDVCEYEMEKCHLITAKKTKLATALPKKTKTGWFRKTMRTLLAATTAITVMHVFSTITTFSTTTNPTEVRLNNGITIYEPQTDVSVIETVIKKKLLLWKNHENIMNVLKKMWMKIFLINNWRKIYKAKQAKIYSLNKKNKKMMNKKFNKYYEQEWLSWTKTETLFTFPVFVIWKMINDEKKNRMVIDIWTLNKIIMSDAYSLSLQTEIIVLLRSKKYILTIDCSKFFHQWRVKRDHRHRLTVSSHRNQKVWNVAIMKYKNSAVYVQRLIDFILRKQRAFAKIYINDIVIFLNIFEEHVEHLRAIFKILAFKRISVSFIKSFLCYSSIKLLKQRVNALDMTTSKNKFIAISKLKFPLFFTQLDHYIDFTEYLRQYISQYTFIIRPLQNRKTLLSKKIESMENVRRHKNYINKLPVNDSIDKEFEAFYQLQDFFSRPTILYHFDFKLQLFIDLDVSKEFGIDGHVYHIFIDLKHSQDKSLNKKDPHPKKNEMKSIMFLSRELTDAETRYWPIEIKVAALIWIIKKIRHLIETTEHPTVVYIDHSAIAAIAQQSSLNTTSVIKLNLRLIRSSEYLQRFKLNIRHIQNKANTISNALSRLVSSNGKKEIEKDVLTVMLTSVYPVMIIHMADEFKTRVISNYANHYLKIIDFIIANSELDFYAANFFYVFKWGLLYYKDSKKKLRFCISDSMIKKIFEQTHDQSEHPGFAATHERITEGLYIFKLSEKLRDYIRNCPQCELNQTFHHSFYEALQSIISFSKPFHIITIDFIVALSESKKNKFDCVISMTDKFSKTVTFIAGYIAKSDK